MKTEQNNLDRFKGKNPFSVPEGYMEGLTANIMSQLPEKSPQEEVKKISLMDRVRPWLYMAAVFAGLGLFFRVLVGPEDKTVKNDSLLVKTEISANKVSAVQAAEDEEYLEYLEERYASYILAGDLSESE
ncbi:hypothetical protein [Parabacteroides sp. AM08-6]|uniref:hypothetical protein n=1 Tax=Parabacteroides sp. AM08-6 TaxID=2292053 RepID=UPI000F007EA0|nr:hypothetical protein [Parabacteroides sp. AM08-6]RHJ86648.1 hypothetical protein DW103_03030 [Parabacteroides sp. AM08-6]